MLSILKSGRSCKSLLYNRTFNVCSLAFETLGKEKLQVVFQASSVILSHLFSEDQRRLFIGGENQVMRILHAFSHKQEKRMVIQDQVSKIRKLESVVLCIGSDRIIFMDSRSLQALRHIEFGTQIASKFVCKAFKSGKGKKSQLLLAGQPADHIKLICLD